MTDIDLDAIRAGIDVLTEDSYYSPWSDGALANAERLREREARRRGKRKYQQMQFPVPVREMLGCGDDGTEADA